MNKVKEILKYLSLIISVPLIAIFACGTFMSNFFDQNEISVREISVSIFYFAAVFIIYLITFKSYNNIFLVLKAINLISVLGAFLFGLATILGHSSSPNDYPMPAVFTDLIATFLPLMLIVVILSSMIIGYNNAKSNDNV